MARWNSKWYSLISISIALNEVCVCVSTQKHAFMRLGVSVLFVLPPQSSIVCTHPFANLIHSSVHNKWNLNYLYVYRFTRLNQVYMPWMARLCYHLDLVTCVARVCLVYASCDRKKSIHTHKEITYGEKGITHKKIIEFHQRAWI